MSKTVRMLIGTMSDLYLIAHKVRGEPAFDVAERLQLRIDELTEETWIIPTSGHRAYPYAFWLLEDLVDASDINGSGGHNRPFDWEDRMPEDLPDHYSARQPSAGHKVTGIDLDDLLGDLD